MNNSAFVAASLLRRMAALVYDGLLMFAVLIVIGATTLPFTMGLGIRHDNILLRIYIFGAVFIYLGWFWTHGGQTLGMRAWKIRLLHHDGRPVVWHLALFYYLVSLPMWGFVLLAIVVNGGIIHTPALLAGIPHWLLYGLALLWFVIDHLPNNWREKVSGIRMIQVA